MTTFVLKKYEEQKPLEGSVTGNETKPEETKKVEEATIEIQASDTISRIVAAALYKALPNNVSIEEQEDKASDTNVVSTEDINSNPVNCISRIKNGSTLMIVGGGFSTQKDEWFLSTLGNKNVNVFYTMESFINHIKKSIGV